MKLGVIDFETEAIGTRPDGYPPRPVSCALLPHRGKPIWLAWGHPTGNNTDLNSAIRKIRAFIEAHTDLLFHNAAFDCAILSERMEIEWSHRGIHDTIVAAFLLDPYARTLELKPLAEKHLGMPPDERERVREWLIEHKVVSKQLKKEWGAFICAAPGDLVGEYAVGDVVRTRKLFDKWKPLTIKRYTQEMRVVRMNIDMERRGVPVDPIALQSDEASGTKLLSATDKNIRRMLRTDIDIDSAELGTAIEARYGIELPRTATGRPSKARATVMEYTPDQQLKALLTYRSALAYSLRNYTRPWLAQLDTRQRVHPTWHSTRSDEGSGARTGRFSSSPNFQNMKDPENQEKLLASLQAMTPDRKTSWWLPDIRRYVKAEKGKVIIGRDYSQIELRLAAEFEDGEIAARYTGQPDMDLHQWVIDLFKEHFGVTILRRIAKNVGFGILYGAGGRAISQQAGVTWDEAVALKRMYLMALPSLKTLMNDVQNRGRRGGYVTTLGGRVYYPEPARIVDGEWRSFEYKLLNYLIQGSAADMMKEAMLDYWDSPEYRDMGDELIMTVHDEMVAQVPKHTYRKSLTIMQRAMLINPIVKKIHIPILSQAYVGPDWLNVKDVA